MEDPILMTNDDEYPPKLFHKLTNISKTSAQPKIIN